MTAGRSRRAGADLVARFIGRQRLLRIGAGGGCGSQRTGPPAFLALVLGLVVVAGCQLGQPPAVSIWVANSSGRAYLIRLSYGPYDARVYHVGPGERGWATGADAPALVRAEMLGLDCRPVANVDLPRMGTSAIELNEGGAITVDRSDVLRDPLADLREVVQVCGSEASCPIVSPWPTGVPFPSEPCPGRY